MAIINRYLIGFVFLSLLIPRMPYAEDTDITFLYTGDLHHFIKETEDRPVFVSGGTLIDGTGAAPGTTLASSSRMASLRRSVQTPFPQVLNSWMPMANGSSPASSMSTHTLPTLSPPAGMWKTMS